MDYKQLTINGKVVNLVNGKNKRNIIVNGETYTPIKQEDKNYKHTITMPNPDSSLRNVVFEIVTTRSEPYSSLSIDDCKALTIAVGSTGVVPLSGQMYAGATTKTWRNLTKITSKAEGQLTFNAGTAYSGTLTLDGSANLFTDEVIEDTVS